MGKSIKIKDLNDRIYLIDDIDQFESYGIAARGV